jgi:hypothetical protein
MIENFSDESLSQPKNISDHDTVADYGEIASIINWFNESGEHADVMDKSDKQMRINQLLMKHSISPGNLEKFIIFKQKVDAAQARLRLSGR